jgi:hypothetical protein
VPADHLGRRVAGDPLGFGIPVDDTLITIDQEEPARNCPQNLLEREDIENTLLYFTQTTSLRKQTPDTRSLKSSIF